MINLYCYNSPSTSSVGFQEGLWVVRNGVCAVMDENEASPQLRGLLLDGGVKALCMDTERGTRAFMLRGIFVRQGAQAGWRMNIILETDQESNAQWLDVVASFLLDYAGFTEQLAGLFSIKYDGGEHYVLNTDGFEQLLCKVNGAAASLCDGAEMRTPAQSVLHTIAGKLCSPLDASAGRLLLLVPTATVDYFMKHTSLKELTVPELCVEVTQWEAILAHKAPENETDTQWTQSTTQRSEPYNMESAYLSDAAFFAIGAASMALLGYSVYRIVRWSRRKWESR